MTLQQLLWMFTALGALVAGAAIVVLAHGSRVREPGLAAVFVVIGVLTCLGGFLLSVPRYAVTGAITAGAAVLGALVGLALGRSPRPPHPHGPR